MALTKDQILAARPPLAREVVSVPKLGGDVIVSELSGFQRGLFESSLVRGKGKKRHVDTSDLRARLLRYALVDEDGKCLFGDEDIRELGRLGAAVLEPLYDKARELSGIDRDDDEETEPGGVSDAS
jgi:hypothetical protein